jgi:two-component system, OmpR family, KDP operon response regulator KdpE
MTAKKTTILVVDDDVQLLKIVMHNLQAEGYQVLAVRDGEQALEAIERDAPDLVLLDVMLPRMDGFQVCQRVREFSAVPIIMITARGRGQDKVKGLDLGADDYLAKPFRLDELLARVRAVLRRAQFTPNEQAQALGAATTIGELTIDYARHRVTKAGREVVLTPTEYRILAYLAQNAGRVVTQDLMLEHVWGPEYVGEGHLLRVNITRLRHKLETETARPRYLLTRPGIGYFLVEDPNTQEAP